MRVCTLLLKAGPTVSLALRYTPTNRQQPIKAHSQLSTKSPFSLSVLHALPRVLPLPPPLSYLRLALGALHGADVRPGVLRAAAAGVRPPEAPGAEAVAALVALSRRPLLLALHAARLLPRLHPLFLGHAWMGSSH